jgi:predicted nuclease with TOPRIM domain
MTGGDITELRYWLDLLIKAVIGVVVSLVGMDYRSVKNSLQELEQSKYNLTMQVQVMQSEVASIKDRLERIEQKLDKALTR